MNEYPHLKDAAYIRHGSLYGKYATAVMAERAVEDEVGFAR